MPKSKADKKISLTKTNKKGLALKQKIIEDIRACVAKYESIYVFKYGNIRNKEMKHIREKWKPSRFFFGKTKVIAVAIGKNKESEIEDDLHELTSVIKGQCALLFTNCTRDEVTDWFESYEVTDYCRSGSIAPTTIKLPEGELKQFPHNMEPYLRQLGLPTKLDRGTIKLLKDVELCKQDGVLTPSQAKILELFDYKLASFKLILKGRWTKGEGFEKFEIEQSDNEDTEMADNEIDQ